MQCDGFRRAASLARSAVPSSGEVEQARIGNSSNVRTTTNRIDHPELSQGFLLTSDGQSPDEPCGISGRQWRGRGTGLRNTNNMFAARQPAIATGDWTGLLIFALSLFVIVGGLFAVRTTLLSPVARLFGQVTRR